MMSVRIITAQATDRPRVSLRTRGRDDRVPRFAVVSSVRTAVTVVTAMAVIS
jgi:hypothetical protein